MDSSEIAHGKINEGKIDKVYSKYIYKRGHFPRSDESSFSSKSRLSRQHSEDFNQIQ